MKHIAVLAISGRMLSQACQQLDYSVHLLDCFNDVDACRASTSAYKLGFSDSGFNEVEVIATLESIQNKYELSGVLVGSGIETCPELINVIKQKYLVFANSAEVFQHAHNARHFFTALTQLQIKHPETVFSAPDSGDWLCKRSGSLGGQHIVHYQPTELISNEHYFQRKEPGQAMSALFFAHDEGAVLIGLHSLILVKEFQYAGAIQFAEDELLNIKKQLLSIFKDLQKVIKVKGLCGLDFILNAQEEINVLELNCRPTATLGLYKNQETWVQAQIDVFSGVSPVLKNNNTVQIRGERILYALKDCEWPADLENLDYLRDIPCFGERFKPEQAICTVTAAATNRAETEKLLYDRQQFIEARLGFE